VRGFTDEIFLRCMPAVLSNRRCHEQWQFHAITAQSVVILEGPSRAVWPASRVTEFYGGELICVKVCEAVGGERGLVD
jgi:hypothetical protein